MGAWSLTVHVLLSEVVLIDSCSLSQHLERQQEGLMHLIAIIKDDLQDLATIERGLVEQPASGSQA